MVFIIKRKGGKRKGRTLILSETVGFQLFLDCHEKMLKKHREQCFPIEWKVTCKNSTSLEEKKI